MIDLTTPSPQDRQRQAARVRADLEETKNMRMIAAAITGPAMVYTGLERKMPKLLKALMITVGVGIVVSNVEKLRKEQRGG